MNSVQLELWTEAELRECMRGIPWDGRSPRGLTRARQALFSRREPQKTPAIFDVDQLPLFPRLVTNAPWVYQGAPLLKEV